MNRSYVGYERNLPHAKHFTNKQTKRSVNIPKRNG